MPIYSCYFAENQKNAYKSFNEMRLIYGGGDLTQLKSDKLLENLKEFIDLPNHQMYMDNQKRMIDGKQRLRYLNLIKEQII